MHVYLDHICACGMFGDSVTRHQRHGQAPGARLPRSRQPRPHQPTCEQHIMVNPILTPEPTIGEHPIPVFCWLFWFVVVRQLPGPTAGLYTPRAPRVYRPRGPHGFIYPVAPKQRRQLRAGILACVFALVHSVSSDMFPSTMHVVPSY
jgi:hypothetical protein